MLSNYNSYDTSNKKHYEARILNEIQIIKH